MPEVFDWPWLETHAYAWHRTVVGGDSSHAEDYATWYINESKKQMPQEYKDLMDHPKAFAIYFY